MYRPQGTGLKPPKRLWRDPRTFNFEQEFGATPLDQLPPNGLGRKPYRIENQRNTNLCTAYATSTAAEYIEKEDMSPEYTAAKISEYVGYPITGGATADSALKTGILSGFLPRKHAQYSLVSDGVDFIVDPRNWQALDEIARQHQMGSYFDVMRGSYDTFDNICSALNKAKQDGEDRVAIAFTEFYSNWKGTSNFKRGTGSYGWHAHLFIDWTVRNGEEVLVQQNSYGTAWGDKGLSYWTREAVNQLAENPRNQIVMYRDVSSTDVKERQWTLGVIIYDLLAKINRYSAGKWLSNFYRLVFGRMFGSTTTTWLSSLIARLLSLCNVPANPPKSPQDAPKPPTPTPEPPPAPKYLWDTRAHARHSVRLICDEEGLTVEQKNTLCATIACESNFNTQAINRNIKNGKVTSSDFGICQINDYWHIGKGKAFPSAQYVLNNPEACVRWMCKMWKANKRNLWVCYEKEIYKKFI